MTQISAEEGPNSVSVKNLSSCEGDVDVSQRKGKIITLFDVKLVLDIEGSTPQLTTNLMIQARQKKMKRSLVQLQSQK